MKTITNILDAINKSAGSKMPQLLEDFIRQQITELINELPYEDITIDYNSGKSEYIEFVRSEYLNKVKQ
jgi:hypothetical protein